MRSSEVPTDDENPQMDTPNTKMSEPTSGDSVRYSRHRPHSPPTHSQETRHIERRSFKETLIEMLSLNFAAGLLGALLILLTSLQGKERFEQATGAPLHLVSDAALRHVGWGFGVAATIVFGCLVAAAGNQIIFGNTREEAKLRRALGLLAEITTSLLLPSVLLTITAGLYSPEEIGALFVVVPIYTLLWVLSVQVGRFNVLESDFRLKKAYEDLELSHSRLQPLNRAPRTPRWLAILLVTSTSVTPCAALTLAWDTVIHKHPSDLSIGIMVCGVATSAVLSYFYIECLAIELLRKGKLDSILGWLCSTYFTVVTTAASILLFETGWRFGTGYALIVATCAGYCLWDIIKGRGGPIARVGPIARAANFSARTSAARTFSRARTTILELNPPETARTYRVP